MVILNHGIPQMSGHFIQVVYLHCTLLQTYLTNIFKGEFLLVNNFTS